MGRSISPHVFRSSNDYCIRGEELTSSGNYLTQFLTKHKESAQAASYLSATFAFVSTGLHFSGQAIDAFNRSRNEMAIITLEHSKDKELLSRELQNRKELFSKELQNQKELLQKQKELFSKELQYEKDQRLKVKEIADVKLSKKGYLW